MFNYSLYIILGIAFLSIGGEMLIRGALAASKRLGISPLLGGIFIVGFGTSAPELVVSIDAAINQQPDIAIGNVVGSNIGNMLLILGICSMITTMHVKPLILMRDASTVLLATLLFLLLAYDGQIQRFDALILITCLFSYLSWTYVTERYSQKPSAELHVAQNEEIKYVPSSLIMIIITSVAGLLLLITGSKILLLGAINVATLLNISEAVIGLTLVAIGTSLPELTISVMAALRRHADVALGNILGSNIFNLLGILGISALFQPLQLNQRIIQFDQWVMLATSVLVLLFLRSHRQLSRIEGASLTVAYIIYVYLSFRFFS